MLGFSRWVSLHWCPPFMLMEAVGGLMLVPLSMVVAMLQGLWVSVNADVVRSKLVHFVDFGYKLNLLIKCCRWGLWLWESV